MIGRVALVLGAFEAGEQFIGISEVARRTALPKATVSRIVRALVKYEFLERHGEGFRLGLKVFELGSRSRRPHDLRRLALATMADLRRATGHTVHLAVQEGYEVVYIEILQGKGEFRLPSRVGGRLPIHVTGVGKALLAFSDPDTVQTVLDGPLVRVGPGSITTPSDLRVELEAIRTHGVAYEREESGAGICCAASPILRATGEPLAAISVSGPLSLLHLDRVAPAVQAATLGLNRQIRQNSLLSHL